MEVYVAMIYDCRFWSSEDNLAVTLATFNVLLVMAFFSRWRSNKLD